jgi:hypothetical protein
MAGRPAPNSQGELGESRESTFMEQFLRRSESNDQEAAAGNSIEGLDAPALSPNSSANPWQYLPSSDPSSPTLHRDFYNLSHSPAPSDYSWMSQELEQQRATMFQAPGSDDVGQRGGARGTLLQRRQQLNAASDLARELPASGAHGAATPLSEAMLYEELAAAWHRSGGHFRADSTSPQEFLQGGEALQGLWDGVLQAYSTEENFTRSDNSPGFQNADSASASPEFGPCDEAPAPRRWQRSMQSGEDSQFVEPSDTHPEASDMDIKTPPSMAVDTGGNAIRSINESAGSPNTSLSSEFGGDSDDEECTRNTDPPSSRTGSELLDSTGKRKTPTAPGELEDKDKDTSAITDLKKTAPSE